MHGESRPQGTPGFEQASGRHVESLWRQQSDDSWDQSGQKSRDERQLTLKSSSRLHDSCGNQSWYTYKHTNTLMYACILRHTKIYIKKKKQLHQKNMALCPLAFSVLPLAAIHPNRWAGVTRLLLTGHLPLLWHGDRSMLHYSYTVRSSPSWVHSHPISF